jgi:hypothetical protein
LHPVAHAKEAHADGRRTSGAAPRHAARRRPDVDEQVSSVTFSFAEAPALLASWTADLAERCSMNKSRKSAPRPLSELLYKTLGEVLARQGFASSELVTHWREIVGPEIADHCQPEKIQWARVSTQTPEPGKLVLRVEGPVALEIQHLSNVIMERVNCFFGWQAVTAVRLRQAPLRRLARTIPDAPRPEQIDQIKASLGDIKNEDLRDALARLGAAIKQS